MTFGIVTDGKAWERVDRIVKDIYSQNIPEFEIIVVGGEPRETIWYTHIPFDETQTEKGWITKKKNIITERANFENIVYLHDYFTFDEGWYESWSEFNEEFDVAVGLILINENDHIYRHADWLVNPYDMWKVFPTYYEKEWIVGLPYGAKGYEKIQYISGGGPFVAKKQFMLDNPLDETLFWGDAEDVEWSVRAREKTTFKFNPTSICWCMKANKWKVVELDEFMLQKIREYFKL